VSEQAAGAPPIADELGVRRISPFERLGALVEILMCSGFPTQIFLVGVMTSFGMELKTPTGAWSPMFVSTLSLLDTALVIALVFLFFNAHRERARDVLLGNRPRLREAVLGLLLLPFVFMLAILALLLLYVVAPQLHNVSRNPFQDMLQNRRDAIIFAVVAMIAGGVREEIQRGFILHRFQRYLGGGAVGVILYSAIFGLGHVDQGWDATITVATLGAVWGTIYLIRGSILAPMVSHAGFNLAQLVKFLAVR
jgi:membrane protease YdiL (CAAX protease family)